jgi:hypothetical protein
MSPLLEYTLCVYMYEYYLPSRGVIEINHVSG